MKTLKTKSIRLSEPQMDVLYEASTHKLSRSSMGWSYDDGTGPDRMYHPNTIRSLWEKGLLDSNFADRRGVEKCVSLRGIKTLDGAYHDASRDNPHLMVWTSALGRLMLAQNGVLVDVSEHIDEQDRGKVVSIRL